VVELFPESVITVGDNVNPAGMNVKETVTLPQGGGLFTTDNEFHEPTVPVIHDAIHSYDPRLQQTEEEEQQRVFCAIILEYRREYRSVIQPFETKKLRTSSFIESDTSFDERMVVRNSSGESSTW